MLPGVALGEGCTVDVRGLPPSVAEVYTLAVLQRLRGKSGIRCASAGAVTHGARESPYEFKTFCMLTCKSGPNRGHVSRACVVNS